MRKLIALMMIVGINTTSFSQNYIKDKFGKGINIVGKDSSFTMRFGVRFQTLFTNDWDIRDDDWGFVEGHESNFLLRRSRFKFDGFAFTPKLKYKMEFGLTNRDMGGGINAEHGFSPRFILDAYLEWNFWKGFSLKFGQGKLPGNRERVISSANMQTVDRSRLNSRFNIDRDIGFFLKHKWKIGKKFTVREVVSLSQGEGRDITVGNNGGYCYTFRGEILPFGTFQSKGDYIGSSIKREDKPKLSLGFTYDINDRAVRQRGQLGGFIYNLDGSITDGQTLNTIFADVMFKYKGFSMMAEFANKQAAGGDPNIYDKDFPTFVIGTQYTGWAISGQLGYMFKNNWELVGRYTQIDNTAGLTSGGGNDETEITFGVNKFFVGHKLKVQTDVSWRNRSVEGSTATNGGTDDKLYWRLQFDIHF